MKEFHAALNAIWTLQSEGAGLSPEQARISLNATYDHGLIESMGLDSVINLAMRYDGKTIGTCNLLDAEHAYDQAALERVLPLAPLLVPAFLDARRWGSAGGAQPGAGRPAWPRCRLREGRAVRRWRIPSSHIMPILRSCS